MEINCPSCGSNEIVKRRYSSQAIAVSILFLGFPLIFFSKTYHCFNCGNDFKIKNNP
jgi:DNA-directed RNA polymerase subunit RPC12/RpoP